MIKDFGFIIPQNCQFGVGALKKLPDFLKAAGSDNVMLISDRGLEAIGVVEKVRKIIKDADLKYAEYLDVLPNPTTTIVDECAAKYKEAGCTALIALGGGSPMDVAKAVGVVAKFGGTIGDYEGVGKVPGPINTLIAVPTLVPVLRSPSLPLSPTKLVTTSCPSSALRSPPPTLCWIPS